MWGCAEGARGVVLGGYSAPSWVSVTGTFRFRVRFGCEFVFTWWEAGCVTVQPLPRNAGFLFTGANHERCDRVSRSFEIATPAAGPAAARRGRRTGTAC